MARARTPSTMTVFLPSDHTRLNDLLNNPGSVPPQHHEFLRDMQEKRVRFRYPKLSKPQRDYLARLHQMLSAQGIAVSLEAVA